MDKQVIYNILRREFPESDNKLLYGASATIWSEVSRWSREQKKVAVNEILSKQEAKKCSDSIYTDEEASERFLNHLKAKAAEGDFDAALAGKIMDAFGIKAKDRDITVETISFKDAFPEESDVYCVTAEVIKNKIAEANS